MVLEHHGELSTCSARFAAMTLPPHPAERGVGRHRHGGREAR
ncbi:hypothetical protein HMPREF0321_2839 [Dermacoccus sp. Ellin185]|nr:hypothetical protein HMPREF0321_2839 [Dermacoccus sp. Ellin185]